MATRATWICLQWKILVVLVVTITTWVLGEVKNVDMLACNHGYLIFVRNNKISNGNKQGFLVFGKKLDRKNSGFLLLPSPKGNFVIAVTSITYLRQKILKITITVTTMIFRYLVNVKNLALVFLSCFWLAGKLFGKIDDHSFLIFMEQDTLTIMESVILRLYSMWKILL